MSCSTFWIRRQIEPFGFLSKGATPLASFAMVTVKLLVSWERKPCCGAYYCYWMVLHKKPPPGWNATTSNTWKTFLSELEAANEERSLEKSISFISFPDHPLTMEWKSKETTNITLIVAWVNKESVRQWATRLTAKIFDWKRKYLDPPKEL